MAQSLKNHGKNQAVKRKYFTLENTLVTCLRLFINSSNLVQNQLNYLVKQIKISTLICFGHNLPLSEFF